MPETKHQKILRALGNAMRCRIPTVYLVEPGQGSISRTGGRVPRQKTGRSDLYYNSIMRRYTSGCRTLGGEWVPHWPGCITSRPIPTSTGMVEGNQLHGLGGPNLVKGATGQTVDSETLGGGPGSTREVSGVAHYRVPD